MWRSRFVRYYDLFITIVVTKVLSGWYSMPSSLHCFDIFGTWATLSSEAIWDLRSIGGVPLGKWRISLPAILSQPGPLTIKTPELTHATAMSGKGSSPAPMGEEDAEHQERLAPSKWRMNWTHPLNNKLQINHVLLTFRAGGFNHRTGSLLYILIQLALWERRNHKTCYSVQT